MTANLLDDGTDNLVRMANRIGDFFAHQPDASSASIDGIANHLEKFWEPRMRRHILDFLATNPEGVTANGTIMHDIVRLAIERHRDRLTPKAASALPSNPKNHP